MYGKWLKIVVGCWLAAGWCTQAAAQVVDATTLNNKVVCGYQGWFTCNGDFSTPPVGWMHWTHTNFTTTIKYDFEMWPDLSEFPAGELFTAPNVTLMDSGSGKLYSATTAASVDRHFKWMKDYGIDGVFLQRFVSELSNASLKSIRDQVLANVRAGANAHGRVFSMEYDLTNNPVATLYADVTNDWKYLVDTKGMLTDPRYLKHNGKPVVIIWGLGFAGRGISTTLAQSIIDFFKSDPTYGGNTVIGGVPGAWRTLTSDSETDPAWTAVYHSYDIIHPWLVGRYQTQAQVLAWKTGAMIPDMADCAANGIEYLPVVWPGFSFDNPTGQPAGTTNISRRGGDFYWKQIASYQNAGANKLFVAMFDEVNEATAIYKISSNVPVDTPSGTPPPPYQWITHEGLANDWYLQLTGSAAQMAQGALAQTPGIPIVGIPTAGSTGLVISQVYGGGGASAVGYKNDFVELYNPTGSAVNFATTNYSVQYTAGTDSVWQKVNLTAGSVPPGKHFLIQLASGGASGANLPTPDLDASASGINLDNNVGKVALVQGTNAITGAAYPPILSGGNTLTDYVGYGAASAWEGYFGSTQAAGTPRNEMSFTRTRDTNNNTEDFFYGYTRARNSAYTPPINSGTTNGSVHINAGGGADYTSLATAVADINQAYNGINANWTILVDGNLTESQNLGVSAAVAAGKIITIKPNTGANPVITFSATTSAPGLNGHLMIGLNSTTLSSDVNMRALNGFTIDGSNNGTTSRNLTIQNSTGAGASYISSVVRIFGPSSDVSVKNCIIKNLSTSAGAADQCCVKVDSRSSWVDLLPSNVRVENCDLQALGSINGVGIRTDAQGTMSNGAGQSGMVFARNNIAAKSRGLKLMHSAGGQVTTNTIVMTQTGSADCIAIEHGGSNNDSGWTLTVNDNTITTLQSATTTGGTIGLTGISLSGLGSGSSASYVCANNMIGGFNFTGSPASPVYRGIYVADAGSSANIYQNSINMPAFAGSNSNAGGIVIGSATYTGVANVRGNIVRMLQPGGSVLVFADSTPSTIASDRNDLIASGANTGTVGASSYVTLANWKAGSGKDTNSVSSDPTVPHAPASGVWTAYLNAPNNLHFTSDPGSSFDAPVINAVAWDMDGEQRTAGTRNLGADAQLVPIPVCVSIVEIE